MLANDTSGPAHPLEGSSIRKACPAIITLSELGQIAHRYQKLNPVMVVATTDLKKIQKLSPST